MTLVSSRLQPGSSSHPDPPQISGMLRPRPLDPSASPPNQEARSSQVTRRSSRARKKKKTFTHPKTQTLHTEVSRKSRILQLDENYQSTRSYTKTRRKRVKMGIKHKSSLESSHQTSAECDLYASLMCFTFLTQHKLQSNSFSVHIHNSMFSALNRGVFTRF